jgi:hypothetical protein
MSSSCHFDDSPMRITFFRIPNVLPASVKHFDIYTELVPTQSASVEVYPLPSAAAGSVTGEISSWV